MYDLGLVNGKVYKDGRFIETNVYVKEGKIKKITNERLDCTEIVDCNKNLVLPGFIDPHVHLNLHLGEFTSADDYESGSIAAAFGGVTTFIDFLEPIIETEEFEEKLKQKMQEGNVKTLVDTILKSGLPSVKVFTTYSESNRKISYEKLMELLEYSKNSGILVLVHAENDQIILSSQFEDVVELYPYTRPPEAETIEVSKLASLVEETGGKLYIVHLTCGTSIGTLSIDYYDLLNKNIFIESCPQYFILNSEVYSNEEGYLYILAPPLRPKEEVIRLHESINLISVIGTDHCPFTKADKQKYKEPSKIPKGLGSMEFSFPFMFWYFGTAIIDKFTTNPAKLHGLFPQKGVIREGSDADLVIFDPNKEITIGVGHSKTDYNPYEGKTILGSVESTILRGQFLVKDREFVGDEVKGKFLRRKLAKSIK